MTDLILAVPDWTKDGAACNFVVVVALIGTTALAILGARRKRKAA